MGRGVKEESINFSCISCWKKRIEYGVSPMTLHIQAFPPMYYKHGRYSQRNWFKKNLEDYENVGVVIYLFKIFKVLNCKIVTKIISWLGHVAANIPISTILYNPGTCSFWNFSLKNVQVILKIMGNIDKSFKGSSHRL